LLETFSLPAYNNGRYKKTDDVGFSNNMTFSEWLKSVHVTLPTPVTPVCYGGSYAAKVSHILKARHALEKVRESLTRGDNLLVGWCKLKPVLKQVLFFFSV